MKPTNYTDPKSWDPPAPRPPRKGYLTAEQIAEQHARCRANYRPVPTLERLLNRVPDIVSTSCRDCGANFITVLGGSLECYRCGAREIDAIREELADAVEAKDEAQQNYSDEVDEHARTKEALADARRDLDERDQEIERLQIRIAQLGGAQ